MSSPYRHMPWITAAIVAALSTTPLRAQPPADGDVPADDEVLVEQAEKLYNEAREARKAGRYADCYGAAAAAWKLSPRPKVAAITGDCALDVGRAREAAERLQYFVDNPPKKAEPKVLEYFKGRLAEAKGKIATVRVKVNVAAAEVQIDKKPVDGAPVFLEPGAHDFEAAHEGYRPAAAHIELAAGEDREVPLELVPVAPDPPPNGGDAQPRSIVPGVVMGSLGAVGLGVGIALVVVAGGKNGDAEDEKDAILAEGGRCGDAPTPGFEARCQDLGDLTSEAQRMQVGGWIGIGVGAALAVAATAYLLWPEESGSTTNTMIAPMVTPDTAGAIVIGSF